MKTIIVEYCVGCPFFHPDYSGFMHRAECWLDIDIMPSMGEIPSHCPLRTESDYQIKISQQAEYK